MPSDEILDTLGLRRRVHRCETLVLSSGAAASQTAVELKRRNVDGGRGCLSDDEQMLHTLPTARIGATTSAPCGYNRRQWRDGRGDGL